jgi:hypothetical protein
MKQHPIFLLKRQVNERIHKTVNQRKKQKIEKLGINKNERVISLED